MSPTEALAANVALHTAWVLGTVLATALNAAPEQLHRVGLDYAPLAMFIALLALMVKDRLQAAVAGACGVMAVTFTALGLGSWSVLLATILGASGGLWVEKWIKRRSLPPSLA